MNVSSVGEAHALTADDVLTVMEESEQRGFIAGAVGGLAFSRYLRDKPDQTGMNCIYDWYYQGGAENDRKIIEWFERHPDKSPEAFADSIPMLVGGFSDDGTKAGSASGIVLRILAGRTCPRDHLLRSIDRFVDLSSIRAHLADFYSHTGRPSVDPELLIRMLLVGYCFGIRSERRLCEEVHLNLAYRWFCRLDLNDRIPDHSTFSKNRHGRFRESELLRHLFKTTVAQCIAGDLVSGQRMAVDASLREADANKQYSAPMLGWLVDRKIAPHIPVIDKAGRPDGTWPRTAFEWDADNNQYICPEGEVLKQFRRNYSDPNHGLSGKGVAKYRALRHTCLACPSKNQCCPKNDFRSITREEHEDARQVAHDIAKTKQYTVSMKLRKKVEMLFAHLKHILGLGRLRLRGPCGANEEFLLTATAQNLRKLAKIFPARQQTRRA